MFTDQITVQLIAGKGGNGIVAWRREKYIPKGGPTGGNGGRGGSLIIQTDAQYFNLDWYRNRKQIVAENGRIGGPNKRQGRKGKDVVIKVPCGTLVKNVETGELIADLTEDGEKVQICEGGRGGRGNETFKSPTNRAPNYCTPGKPGETATVELELKLIADVGLVGFPNAGKSTLMRALTRVNVKAAPYPFTTLRPNIGFFTTKNYERIFIADIPGIIAGASDNRGLGMEFLRHIERTKLLIFMLDASGIDGRNPYDDYQVLIKEIEAYNPLILKKPTLVVLNKIDDDESAEHLRNFYRQFKGSSQEISALTGQGLPELITSTTDIFEDSSKD
ncbi:MAG: GTPase Obg [Chlamydiae bacterium]|nr:GTPase Obg [Chlamydiota bacterium]